MCGKHSRLQPGPVLLEIRGEEEGRWIRVTDRVDLVLKNVHLGDGRTVDLSLAGGVVVHAGAARPSYEILDCSGLYCLPAAVDMHVHMRGGRESYKEDWSSGSRSALAGGVTVVVDQPNTDPPLTTAERLRERIREAEGASLCSFAVNGALSPDADLEGLWAAGALCFGEGFTAPSTSARAIGTSDLPGILTRIRSLDGLATIHAEEVADLPDTQVVEHNLARSPAGEVRIVRAVQEANTAGCRLHFCHLSTADAVDAAQGTVEVTPHHLLLSLEDFLECGGKGKVNPPLREEAERRALFSRWDAIDVIASDHAPHTPGEKAFAFTAAPAGFPGVETMVPLLMAEVIEGRIDLTSLIEKTSAAPASILGIPPAGFIPGNRADFALYPREIVRIEVDALHSRAGWTPFEGMPAVFPRIVVQGGVPVYREGEFAPAHPRWYAGKGFMGTESV